MTDEERIRDIQEKGQAFLQAVNEAETAGLPVVISYQNVGISTKSLDEADKNLHQLSVQAWRKIGGEHTIED